MGFIFQKTKARSSRARRIGPPGNPISAVRGNTERFGGIDFRSAVSSDQDSRRVARSGYTLVELMIGVLILGIVFATTFAAINQVFFLIESARHNTRTAQILQGEMESLRTMDWASLSALQSESTFEAESGSLASYGDDYTCERVINTVKADQREVLLKVNWTDTRGLDHQQNYITYFTKEGLNDFYYRTF